MVTKNCKICGEPFNAIGKTITCSDECSAINKREYDENYYNTHREQWRWYHENRRVHDWGTGGLGEKATKEDDGSIDFHAERIKIAKEMRSMGLRK